MNTAKRKAESAAELVDEQTEPLRMTGAADIVLRIAFLSSRLDCYDGVASHIELLASHLVRHQIDLTMITGLTSGIDVASGRYAALRRLFPRWYQVDERPLRPRIKTIRKIAAILRAGRFDVIHVHGVKALLLAKIAAMGLKIPIVTTYHPSAHAEEASDFAINLGRKDRVFYRLILETLRPSSLIALSSDSYDLFVRKTGLSPSRVRQIMCGVDTSHFRVPTKTERTRARSRLGVDDDTVVFVLPGRLNLNKGHDVVITGFNALRRSNPEIKLKCFFPGAGAQATQIKALIDESADPSMFALLGFIPDIRDAYWAADVALLPSRNEGFAIVIAEAMACGCVAIRTPAGGSSDQIIEGQTGYLMRFNSSADLAQRVHELCTTNALHEMRSCAALHARRMFSAERMGAETIRLYREHAR